MSSIWLLLSTRESETEQKADRHWSGHPTIYFGGEHEFTKDVDCAFHVDLGSCVHGSVCSGPERETCRRQRTGPFRDSEQGGSRPIAAGTGCAAPHDRATEKFSRTTRRGEVAWSVSVKRWRRPPD